MSRKRKAWSKSIEEHGVSVRLYERAPGSLLYREVRDAEGQKDRKSLGHRDRAVAEQQVRALVRLLAEHRLTGFAGTITFVQAWRLYERHRMPLLTEERQHQVRMHAAFIRAHLGDAFPLEDLGQTHVDAFAKARREGKLAGRQRNPKPKDGRPIVRDDTIRNNLVWLVALLRWCRGFRVNGRPLMTTNPLEGVTLPREKNVRRPLATEDRFRRTMAKADTVDQWGRLACILALARYTGRRVNALCNLRASDVLLTQESVGVALGAIGHDPALAEQMPHGALRFRAEFDKIGYDDVAPMSIAARAAIDTYLRRHPTIGEAPLFPRRGRGQSTLAIRKMDAYKALRRAETLADLPRLDRGAFHTYRRLFATERMHLPDVAVMKAAGWRDPRAMKRSYQHADPATVLSVLENARGGHTQDTPPQRSADESSA